MNREFDAGCPVFLPVSRAVRFWRKAHPAGVDGHADDGVDAEGVEIVHFVEGRDAAGGDQPAGRGTADRFDGARSMPCIRPSVSTCV